MELENSILEDVREGLNAPADFDKELIMHINGALGILNQNGVGSMVNVTGVEQTWNDLQDPLQVEGNKLFHMVLLFIVLSTKVIFDPPPPSTVAYYSGHIDQILWRLRVAYEVPPINNTTD